MPGDDTARLARLMEERRLDLRMTWQEVARLGGTTTETLRQVRAGASPMRPLTKRAIEEGLAWEAGSVDRILRGGDPSCDRDAEGTIRSAPDQPRKTPLDPEVRAWLAILADPSVPEDQKELMRAQMRLWVRQIEVQTGRTSIL